MCTFNHHAVHADSMAAKFFIMNPIFRGPAKWIKKIGGGAQTHFLVLSTFQNDFIYEMVEEFLLFERDCSGKGFII